MKGVILAGGMGTRLKPHTNITNKHLLPVYSKPMIYYPIECLVKAGITDILIVTGGNDAGDFLTLLGNGKEFGLEHINYTYQEGHGGIADALKLAEYFAGGENICVILGDNIIEKNIISAVDDYKKSNNGGMIFLKEVPNPERFGVPIIEEDKIISIEEKPENPKSSFAVIGIYIYDSRVFDIIKDLKPSDRNELEITDVNNKFIEYGEMKYSVLDGWWADAGTSHDSLLRASNLVKKTGANNG